MPLIREICERCVSQNAHRYVDYAVVEHLFGVAWDVNCVVVCPYADGELFVSDGPPEGCIYLTEHVVSQDAE